MCQGRAYRDCGRKAEARSRDDIEILWIRYLDLEGADAGRANMPSEMQ